MRGRDKVRRRAMKKVKNKKEGENCPLVSPETNKKVNRNW